MTATGVASPSAQGQEITKTLIAIFSAREICTFPPAAPMTTQTMSVTSAMRRTTGTNTPAILSTVRSMGALLVPALRTSLMNENGVALKECEEEAAKLSGEGKTVLYLAEGGDLVALIGVADTLKEGSKEAVARLIKEGLTPIMLTGDSQSAAKAIAAEVGIERVYSEVLPEDKLAAVRENQKEGMTAMVGDGINDSPALKQADVGMAMGNGTDVAIDSADVVLGGGDLRSVNSAIELSRATVRNIKENLFWAFIYNVLGIPVAAGVLYSVGVVLNPMIGALAMSLSSVFVVANALRLTAFKPKSGAKIKKKGERNMKKILVIEGMSCSHCSARVESALNAIEGVHASVNLKKKTAEVDGDAADEILIKAVEDAGYSVKKIK